MFPFIIIGGQILIGIAVVIAIIVLIVKRVQDADKETFERRDN